MIFCPEKNMKHFILSHMTSHNTTKYMQGVIQIISDTKDKNLFCFFFAVGNKKSGLRAQRGACQIVECQKPTNSGNKNQKIVEPHSENSQISIVAKCHF